AAESGPRRAPPAATPPGSLPHQPPSASEVERMRASDVRRAVLRVRLRHLERGLWELVAHLADGDIPPTLRPVVGVSRVADPGSAQGTQVLIELLESRVDRV